MAGAEGGDRTRTQLIELKRIFHEKTSNVPFRETFRSANPRASAWALKSPDSAFAASSCFGAAKRRSRPMSGSWGDLGRRTWVASQSMLRHPAISFMYNPPTCRSTETQCATARPCSRSPSLACLLASGPMAEGQTTSTVNICGRTPVVKNEILRVLETQGYGTHACESVPKASLGSLGYLRLSVGGKSLAQSDLNGLSGLQSIRMDDSPASATSSFPAGLFDDSTSLTRLGIYVCLDPLPPGLFDKLTALKTLHLFPVSGSHGFDPILAGHSYSPEHTPDPECPPSSFPQGIFDKLAALESLIVHQAGLQSLPSGAFDKLTALKKLSVRNNKHLASLPSGLFDKLTALETLNVNHHQRLASLPSGLFDKLTALNEMNLSYNGLDRLSPNLFDKLTALAGLDLGRNHLHGLNEGHALFAPLNRSLVPVLHRQAKPIPPPLCQPEGGFPAEGEADCTATTTPPIVDVPERPMPEDDPEPPEDDGALARIGSLERKDARLGERISAVRQSIEDWEDWGESVNDALAAQSGEFREADAILRRSLLALAIELRGEAEQLRKELESIESDLDGEGAERLRGDALLRRSIEDEARIRELLGERLDALAKTIPPNRLRIIVPPRGDGLTRTNADD